MRILIVEDDDKIKNFLKKNLEAECYAVDFAPDGIEGYNLIKLNPYDLVIMDNIMPRMTGLELCSHLRSERIFIPILLLTSQSGTDMKVAALNAGADDYLTKPFSLDELLARVRALLRRPKNIESEILTYEDLTVDTKKHIVKVDGSEVSLTRKEFMLLWKVPQN